MRGRVALLALVALVGVVALVAVLSVQVSLSVLCLYPGWPWWPSLLVWRTPAASGLVAESGSGRRAGTSAGE